MAVQRGIAGRFDRPDIQTRCADLAGFECREERVLVEVLAAAGVDDDDAVLHLCDRFRVDQRAAVDCRCMDADEVGLRKQLVHFDVRNAEFFFDARDVEDIIRDDLHADRLRHLRHHLWWCAFFIQIEYPIGTTRHCGKD